MMLLNGNEVSFADVKAELTLEVCWAQGIDHEEAQSILYRGYQAMLAGDWDEAWDAEAMLGPVLNYGLEFME